MRRNKQKYKISTSTELDYMRAIKITIGVVLVLAIVYFTTAYVSGEFDKKEKKTVDTVETPYKEIIGGTTFNQTDSEYYVLFYDFSDTYSSYYQSLVKNYKAKDNSLPVYAVDLGKKINAEFKRTDDDIKTPDSSVLKVENPTLLRIKDKIIAERVEDREKVIEKLK